MSPSPPARAAVEEEVLAWIDATWSDEITVRDWWAALADRGYAAPTLPTDAGGRGWPPALAAAVAATLAKANVLGPPAGLGLLLAAPTLVDHGTPEQIDRYLRPILDGTEGWCQLFSEPQAGSDLAGLQTSAERDGDEWRVTGQKVWSSTAQTADRAMLLARTDPDAPKRRGITYFVLEMDQPGVEVRPLREMTGRAVFNEVFLDGATVRHLDIVGSLDEGWRVANTTLAHERAGAGHGGAAFAAAAPGQRGGDLDRPAADYLGRPSPITGGAVGRRHLRALRELAEAAGRLDDPVTRQAVAGVHARYELTRMMGWKAKADRSRRIGVEGNVAKVFNSDSVTGARDAANGILGPEGQLADSDGWPGVFQEFTLFSPGPRIYAGSDEIQRNLIGERGLGLPREPGPHPDTPFRDLPKN
ncbi:MAG: acyl-CoA dehydrogenase family protein [Actinomycetota bacterium]